MLYDYFFISQFIDEVDKNYLYNINIISNFQLENLKPLVQIIKFIRIQLIIIILISIIIISLLNLISKKTFYDREKNRPFECGFDPKNFARLPFSLHFFLIAIIFIIFDIELTLLLPIIIIKNISNYWTISLTLTIFIIILIIGIYHETNQGALNWSN